WSAVQAGSRGVAVVSSGLHVSAVRDLPERPLALTLFRSTRRTVFTDGEPGGLLIGDLAFRYWLVPLAGPPDPVHLLHLGQQLAAGIRDVQLRAEDGTLHPTETSMPPASSLLTVDGPGVVTSLRAVADGVEVRAYNPTQTPVDAQFRWGESASFARAIPVNFEGDPIGTPLPVSNGTCRVQLSAKQILTLRFVP